MYLMYVDESGDPGLVNSPSSYFILSGLVVHELKWKNLVDDLKSIRSDLKIKYGISMRDEMHASEFMNKRHKLELKKHIRLHILKEMVERIALLNYISITNVCIDKQGKPSDYDVFTSAWQYLFQRFENTLTYKNFPGPANPQDCGIVFCDDTNGKKLQNLVRKMCVYNPVPNIGGNGYRNLPVSMIIEDPNMRNSNGSFPIQCADLCAYMLYQYMSPNSYIKHKGAKGYFTKLNPILNVRASPKQPYGIVMA